MDGPVRSGLISSSILDRADENQSGSSMDVILRSLCVIALLVDRYLLSGIVNAVSLESTTKIASKLAGSIALAFSLTV